MENRETRETRPSGRTLLSEPMLLGLGVLLLLATSSAGVPCRCSALLQFNCSAMDLQEVPRIPPETRELHLQDNRLTAIPPGALDPLTELMKVDLSGNPFHCDCGIRYLRSWLLRHQAVVTGGGPTCASPGPVALRDIVDLGDELFSSCAVEQGCFDVASNSVLGAMLCGLVVLLLWCMRLAKDLTFTLDVVQKHAAFEAESLRSRKPKHRKRVQCACAYVSGESSAPLRTDHDTTFINMALLHKKHNIKMKST